MTKRETILNGELSLSWPKGFYEITEEEMKDVYRGDDSRHWGLWDKERDLIVMVLWKKYPALAIRLTSKKKMVKKNEKMTRAMCSRNEYRFEHFFVQKIAGITEGGFCYSYSAGEKRQAVKTVLIQRKEHIYSISCYGREENAKEDRERFDTILDSVSFTI